MGETGGEGPGRGVSTFLRRTDKSEVRILLAEDDSATRRTVEHLLVTWGHQVIACADGEEAWSRFREEVPRLLLLDWVMPGLDGLDVCRQVRGHPAGETVQVVMLTGRADLSDVEAALAAGADDYVIKPVDAAQLKIRLQVAAHRLQLQTLLRESEERQGCILDALPAIVWAVNREGVITYGSGAGLAAMGLTAADLLGRSYHELFAGCPEIVAIHARALAGYEEVVDGQLQGRSVVARLRPLYDGRGEVDGAVGVAQDVSAERQLEAQITQAMKMEVLGQLVASIAHDFNNLLTGMMGHIELLQLDAGEALQEDLAGVMEAAHHGAELTRQLLSFSRRREPGMSEVDVGDLCGQAVRLVRRMVKGQMEVTIQVADGVPRVWGDAEQVYQVVMNLCINARDAVLAARRSETGEEGMVAIEVDGCGFEGEDEEGGREVVIRVRDNGCGMDEETRQRLFEPFFTTKGEHGTGLGLATVQRLVDRHHGRIEVESTPGEGSLFVIHLPAVMHEREACAVGGGDDG